MKLKIFTLSFLCSSLLLSAKAITDSSNPDQNPKTLSYSSVLLFPELSGKATGIGAKFCTSNLLNVNPKFSIGPSVFLERLVFPKYLEEKNIKNTRTTLLSPGLNGKYHLNPNCDLQLDLTLLIGFETRERIVPSASGRTVEDPKPLSGLQLEQTFFYRVSQKKGVQLGIGVFERITDSNIYHSDFGIKTYVGFGW
ncbi:MAG TPA: hypothetical protein VFF27_13445 [Bacteroidia bacterium]|jgi:hypothetical protein|nr:hypothetical protein [Bacteroidia bacterium]